MRNPGIALWLMAAMTTSASGADRYVIDSRHTFPFFEVSHHGYALQRGRFNSTQGTIALDTANGSGSIRVTIDADSIDMGLESWTDEMRSPKFFHVEKYPTITFESDALHFDGCTPVAADGTLTILGVDRPVRLEIADFVCKPNPYSSKPTCGANVTATIKRSDFGMTELLPGVGDEVRILIGVEAVKEGP